MRSLILIACLVAFTAARRYGGDGGGRLDGDGERHLHREGGHHHFPRGLKCADGAKPACECATEPCGPSK